MSHTETPILLLTGYLGSGKTTLVNHILSNERGIKFAVIVNDIGEVNIDASLIQKGGVVGKKDESLVSLQNGCICCTLKMDLIEQVQEILKMQRFDYIVIEASGICEPAPIAQTLCSIPQMGEEYLQWGTAPLDCIVTVVDALRMQSEFACGEKLTRPGIDEEDIENLLIEQIEFCNLILLNKASEVEPQELERLKQILLTLQPSAKIIECDYTNVELAQLLHTGLFRFDRVATSAGWIKEISRQVTEEEEYEAKHPEHHHHHHDDDHDEEECHCHEHSEECHCDHHHHDDDEEECHCHEHGEECHCGHHHHHHHEGGEVEEYGIGTFVYYRRAAFDIHKFDRFIATQWPQSVIRTKGVCYFAHNRDMSYLFEQAGVQKKLREAGIWYAAASEEDLMQIMQQDPDFLRDWDDKYGDRMVKLVFIGQKMDKEQITRDLDACLEM